MIRGVIFVEGTWGLSFNMMGSSLSDTVLIRPVINSGTMSDKIPLGPMLHSSAHFGVAPQLCDYWLHRDTLERLKGGGVTSSSTVY